jgi:amidase
MAASKRAIRDQELETEAENGPQLPIADRAVFLRCTAREISANIERGVWTASQVLEAFIAQSLVAHSATNCITEGTSESEFLEINTSNSNASCYSLV